MPPRITYSKEMILSAAGQIIRNDGVEKLNARSIAQAIGGSTQPIYREFPSIEAVVEAVIEQYTPYVLGFMLDAKDDESEFLSIGLGYLRCAREEPHLFTLFFTSGRKRWNLSDDNRFLQPLLEKMRRDWFLRDLSDQPLKQLFQDMFIYTHGLCTLNNMNISENDPKKERQLLHDIGGQLIFMTLLREKNPDLIENWKRSFKNEDLSIER